MCIQGVTLSVAWLNGRLALATPIGRLCVALSLRVVCGVCECHAYLLDERGLEFALVQDATGKTASEIYEMGDADRYLTAMIRARFYRERNKKANQSKPRR